MPLRGVDAERVRPSREDPVVRAASVSIGGPIGDYARAHRWLSPLVVALLVATVAMTGAVAQKNPCAQGAWWDGTRAFANLCYSDLSVGYTSSGLAERVAPMSDGDGRWPEADDTPPTAVVSYVSAVTAQVLSGLPDVDDRADRPVAEVSGDEDVRDEAVLYVAVAAVVLLLAALLSTAFLVGTHRFRPWDAMGFAAAPLLVLTGLIGWELLAVACTCGALWAWSRRRVHLAGALVGLGAAFDLYPALLLLAFLLTAGRAGRLGAAGRAAGTAIVTWVAINLPAYLAAPTTWLAFWETWLDAEPSYGAFWEVFGLVDWHIDSTLASQIAVLGYALVLGGVAWVGLTARRRPRVPQLAFLALAGVILLSKRIDPQDALWLLPLAALARPYWRDLLIWQACEAYYFCAVWWHLGGYTSGGGDGVDELYILAVLVRFAGIGWLVAMVLRDIYCPWYDPVRADGLTDDPAGGEADHAPDALLLR
jgi:Glycosyltransferase family 87